MAVMRVEPDGVDQQVGGGVVGNRDHQPGEVAEASARARRWSQFRTPLPPRPALGSTGAR